MSLDNFMLFADYFGTAVFAISGAIAAVKNRMDIFGIIVIASVTAIGGGTLRDIILNKSVFWVKNPVYLLIIFLSAIATFVVAKIAVKTERFLTVFDAAGLAFFTVIGTSQTLPTTYSWLLPLVMGVMTGVVGGMLRDLLCGFRPYVLRREIYATASVCGSLALIAMYKMHWDNPVAVIISICITFGIRMLAVRWNLSLPKTLSLPSDNGSGES